MEVKGEGGRDDVGALREDYNEETREDRTVAELRPGLSQERLRVLRLGFIQ